MQSLHKEIYNVIEDHKYLTIKLAADFIECTKQELSHFLLNGGLSFRKLLRLSFLLHPENQKVVMENWCLRLNTTESIKQSFEYASITRNIELLKKLLDKYQGEKGSMGKYVAIYSILYDFYINSITAQDLISRLEKAGPLKGELVALSKIIECYNYYYDDEYHLMLATVKQAKKIIDALTDRQLFIKETYLHRIFEILGHVSLQLNDIESARFYASAIINAGICAKSISGAYYILGMTFLSEDKAKAIKYLQMRYEITKTLGEQNIERNDRRELDFAKLYLDVQLDADSDPILQRLQNNKGSEFELKLIKEAIFKQGDDDFLLLLSAIAKNSIDQLHTCRKYFFKQTNYFFASLAAREAQKMGESSSLIVEFIEHKIETKGDVGFEENFIRCFNHIGASSNSISA